MNRSYYLPKPRNCSLEFILYCLEQGILRLAVYNVMITIMIINLINGSIIYDKNSIFWNLLRFVIYYVSIPTLFVIIFISKMVLLSFYEQYKLDKNYPNPPNWNNSSETGIKFNNKELLKKYQNKKIAIHDFIEYYLRGDIDLVENAIEILKNRYNLFTFVLTMGHFKFFVNKFLFDLFGHDFSADANDIKPVYNRGNDFYHWFLGKSMVYTSAIFHTKKINDETLEDGQYRKIHTILDSIHIQKDDRLLDIGCGWGTLIIEAAKKYGCEVTGCSISKEQILFAKEKANESKVSNLTSWILDDYRNIPKYITKNNNCKKFSKITCIEMAEHVGIKNFTPFLNLVSSLLEDDGIFYLQMCGLRRTWCFEDIVWGLFMGKYIFPSADASTPINFVINQLERNGFEIHRMENCGVHYSRTIELWYFNWLKNKETIIQSKYGKYWYRLFDIFLGWSTLIARQGTSAVYMITCQKNLMADKESFNNNKNNAALKNLINRTELYIGNKPIAYQQ